LNADAHGSKKYLQESFDENGNPSGLMPDSDGKSPNFEHQPSQIRVHQ